MQEGQKCYEIDRGLSKASITAGFTFSTSVMMCPPMLIYSYKRIPSEITQRVPDDWSITATYKMFEEFVGSKNEIETALKRWTDVLEETSSEDLELQVTTVQ